MSNREARDRRPNLRPVQRIEVDESMPKKRLIATAIAILIAAIALFYAINGLLRQDPGWMEIEAQNSDKINCSKDFVVNYYVGSGSTKATTEKKALIALYSDASEYCYKVFDTVDTYDDVRNLAYLNQHINEVVEVDSLLYSSLEKALESNQAILTLGPVYEYYNNVFYAQTDDEAKDYVADYNEDIAEEYSSLCAISNNAEMISVELLGNNQVKLNVASEYEAFCKENDYHNYLDFYWMKNAFIIDYMADIFNERGYVNGYISSVDGYVRNLDNTKKNVYGLNLYDHRGDTIYDVGVLEYQSNASTMVTLRAFPIASRDDRYYYEMSTGVMLNRYLDPESGMQNTATEFMVAYKEGASCADMILELAPLYISDMPVQEIAKSLSAKGVDTVYYDGTKVCTTSDKLVVEVEHEEYSK